MPPVRIAQLAREPHFDVPALVKDSYGVGQPLASIAGTRLYSAFSPLVNHTGVAVTPFTAMQASAVYACVRCLAEDLAKLPLHIYRALPSGGWQVDRAHPLARLFARPNRWQTPFDFWSYVVTCLHLRGNAYIFVLRDDAGQPRALIPISPDRCTVRLSGKGWLFYDVWHPAFRDGENLTVHQDDMLHIKNMSLDGFMGLSTITAAAEAMGLSLATQQHGATLFRQGTQATGVLTHPGVLNDVARRNVTESWMQRYTGVENANKVLLLEEGMKFDKLSMTADEAQFLETRKFQVEEICRFFRVPPHKVAALDRATFSNIEDQGQSYIDDSLIPMARKIEQSGEHNLLFDDERAQHEMRFDFDSLLRGNRISRYAANHTALGDGWKSRNEVRREERLPPIPGGDEYRVALNTGPSTAATDLLPVTVPASQSDPAGAILPG